MVNDSLPCEALSITVTELASTFCRGSQQGGGGPMGMGGPMDLSRSGAKVQMQPDTGVTFNDVVGVDNGERNAC